MKPSPALGRLQTQVARLEARLPNEPEVVAVRRQVDTLVGDTLDDARERREHFDTHVRWIILATRVVLVLEVALGAQRFYERQWISVAIQVVMSVIVVCALRMFQFMKRRGPL